MRFTFDMNESLIARHRGLEEGGRVQQYVDNQVITLSDPLVPFKDGDLKKSATAHTVKGSGEVVYKTPYAAKQYYVKMNHEGERTDKWFEVMKKKYKQQILEGAQRVAQGGEG